MARARNNGMLDFFTKKKVTYRRDVASERAQLLRDQKAQDRADARELKQLQIAETKRKAERRKADDADRKIEKEWREKGHRNPDCARTLKDDVSDRAKRYRANQDACLPAGPEICALCQSRRDIMVDHKDGDESNGAKSNLRWLCRSCNTRLGAKMARQGKGQRTAQYNPAADPFEAGAEAARMYRGANIKPDRNSLAKFKTWKREHGKGADSGAMEQFTAGFRSAAPDHWTRNPGAQSSGEYLAAVLDHTRGAHDAGGKIIHDTPKRKRKEYASDFWNSRKARGNPELAAAELAEAWHGRPAKSATDYLERVRFHGVLTDLGQLMQLRVMVSRSKAQAIDFDKKTRLCSSENGKQLYVVGGDQSLNLRDLKITGDEAEKDLVAVGEVYSVTYITAKHHLGKADSVPGPYEHVLGEDGGERPILIYDTLNESIGFAGGSYKIDPTDYDGRHSAGIRN